ncbi:MAG TPA: energy-coupling factor ABC transporter ATP-binding protein [candidate division Zixibacteria bacterium]|nr:energy-coupling factor ABC transporter ATP-binding protein [candidate division Zixibacteria bacterium]
MSYLLDIKSVKYSYPNSAAPILDCVDLQISAGEMVALFGKNGSGKTTLALIAAGIIAPNEGSVLFSGQDIFADDYHATPGEVGFLFQDPSDGIIATSVEREIAFTPENAQYAEQDIRTIVNQTAEDFRLSSVLRKNIDELSGGMLERCALAGVMAGTPSLLILDEPDSFLDAEGKRLFWKRIIELKQSGTAILFITQNTKVATLCDRAMFITDGIIKTNVNNNSDLCPIILDNKRNDIIYQLDNISFSYNSTPVICDINMTVHKGERIAILGPSGSGKTTLARIIACLYQADAGGLSIDKSVRVGICSQFPSRQLFAETVIADVEFGPRCFQLDNPQKCAHEALELVNVPSELYEVSPFELSDGQQRRVGIAGVLAIDPDILILDEPTAALDPDGKIKLRNIIELLSNQGKTIIIITHDVDFAQKCTQRAVILNSGKVICDAHITDERVLAYIAETTSDFAEN